MNQLVTTTAAFAVALVTLQGCCPSCKPPPPPEAEKPQMPDIVTHIDSLHHVRAGRCDGFVTVNTLRSNNDVGIGIFAGFDGDFVMSGNSPMRAVGGRLHPVEGTNRIATGTATWFDMDQMFDVGPTPRDVLENAMDWKRKRKGSLQVYRIHGAFQEITIRSLPAPAEPCASLSDAESQQTLSTSNNIAGTLIGFWSPERLKDVMVPGYHYVFVSEAGTWGGRVADYVIQQARIEVDENNQLRLLLTEP